MPGYVISPEAVQDLRDIRAFIALDNPNAAERVIDHYSLRLKASWSSLRKAT